MTNFDQFRLRNKIWIALAFLPAAFMIFGGFALLMDVHIAGVVRVVLFSLTSGTLLLAIAIHSLVENQPTGTPAPDAHLK